MRREIGVVGLGKMGEGLARNLLGQGWRVVGHNRTVEVAEGMADAGLEVAYSLEEVAEKLEPPRVVWLMLPAGKVTDSHVDELAGLLDEGDVIIDGGNGFFEDDRRRAERLEPTGIRYVDVGVSGGPRGAEMGACLMVGGSEEDFRRLEQLYADLSADQAYAHFPGAGAGHFVKMVHNGIEYGMMQSIAEGFAIMHESDYDIDLRRAADVYDHASVIESRLIGWLEDAYEDWGEELEGVSGTVGHTGEGEWTARVGREMGLDVRAIEGAFRFRVESEEEPSYAGRVLSALRNRFGGHSIDRD